MMRWRGRQEAGLGLAAQFHLASPLPNNPTIQQTEGVAESHDVAAAVQFIPISIQQ